MTDFASLSGVPVVSLRLVVPAQGIWHADVVLATATDVSGPQTLLLSGSTWTCAVTRAVDFAGVRGVRVVGGAGGWRQSIASKAYASPVGVPTSTVLGDVTLAIGEPPVALDASVAPNVGQYYVRQQGAAALVLWGLVETKVLPQWWMDPTGIVQTAPRDTSAIAPPFVAEAVSGAAGWYRIATEFPADWMPGRSFSGPTVSGTISRVQHLIARGKFWTEILSP